MIEARILSEKHLEKLTVESAISEPIVSGRGYRTVNKASELEAYGFTTSQRRAPVLLIPVYAPDGSNGLYQIRPDLPRTKRNKDGKTKTLKYEMPAGATMRIDCPPACRPMMGDPAIPIWITEGIPKGDSLASQGLCAIALLGVWLFKGKNELGGVTISVDLDSIAWNSRQVRIVFDSDVMEKPSVRKAQERLAEILRRRGAAVTAVYLPNGPDGEKVGVDDYLRDHTVAELEALVRAPRMLPQPAPAIVELLDAPPQVMHRPLQIIGSRAYAATWLYTKTTEVEGRDKDGNIVRYDTPKVTECRRMFIIRDDGVIFGDGGDEPFSDLEFSPCLREPLQDRVCMSKKAVTEFRNKKKKDISELFKDIADVFDQFLDFDGSLAEQRTMCEMASCFAIATWFLEAFNAAGYIYPTGPAGSGKTQFLSLMCQIAFLGEFVQASCSFAAIRDLSNYGAFLGFDDAENVSSKNFDADKRNILLSGTKRGSQVTVKEPDPKGRGWITKYINTFAFRGFSAIRSPDPTLGSRTITVPLIRTSNKKKGDSDPLDFDLWPISPDEIRSAAWQIALKHLAEMQFFERTAKARASLTGRDLEAWTGVLAVAAFIDSKNDGFGLFDRMNSLSLSYQRSRPELEAADLTRLILRSIVYCIHAEAVEPFDLNEVMADNQREWRVTTAEITAKAHELISNEELDFDKETTTSRQVGTVVGKLRIPKKSNGKKRGWRIQAATIEKHLKSYSLLSRESWGTDVSDVIYATDVNNLDGWYEKNRHLDDKSAISNDFDESEHYTENVSIVNDVNNVKRIDTESSYVASSRPVNADEMEARSKPGNGRLTVPRSVRVHVLITPLEEATIP